MGLNRIMVYKSHSSSIFDVLEDMKEKAVGGRSWELVRRFIRICFVTFVPNKVQGSRCSRFQKLKVPDVVKVPDVKGSRCEGFQMLKDF